MATKTNRIPAKEWQAKVRAEQAANVAKLAQTLGCAADERSVVKAWAAVSRGRAA